MASRATLGAMSAPPPKRSTIEDLLARADADRLELVGGQIIERAVPSPDHSWSEGRVYAAIIPFNRKPGDHDPGGWWIFPEIHVAYATGELFCHDVAGWRRDRNARPSGWPVRSRPDWVCEIVSPSHERHDLVTKPTVLHAAEVPHYWVVDPVTRLLFVHRWSPDGYVVVQRASAEQTIRAEPFDQIELRVSALFDDD